MRTASFVPHPVALARSIVAGAFVVIAGGVPTATLAQTGAGSGPGGGTADAPDSGSAMKKERAARSSTQRQPANRSTEGTAGAGGNRAAGGGNSSTNSSNTTGSMTGSTAPRSTGGPDRAGPARKNGN